MSIFSVDGMPAQNAFGHDGSALVQAYDINGNELFSGGGKHRDWSEMPASFVSSLNGALTYIQRYLNNHQNAFAFPVFTDVHTWFSCEEPNYIAWHAPNLFSVFLFLGDMTNGYIESQFSGAVNYMRGATGQKLIVSIGNHDFGDVNGSSNCWAEGDALPKTYWLPLLDASCVFLNGDTLEYYWDEEENGVRYIMLDSNSTVLKPNGVQKFNMDSLKWLAEVLETSGNKDVIVLNHAMGSGFYLVTDTAQELWQNDTSITNIGTFNSILLAFRNKTSVSVTVNGASSVHDYSKTSGNLIGYMTGHYHDAGFTDSPGFNKWTCPALTRGGGNADAKGMSFFLVDKELRKVSYIIARLQRPEHEVYEYSY